MKVLVACEYSGRVRDAFRRYGHDAWSCDLLECEADPQHHYQCPVEEIIDQGWDLMVAHPPCTYLAVSGMHWTKNGHRDPQLTEDALAFVQLLMDSPIQRWCIENPVSIISTRIRKADQTIHPWQHGHGETKATCLWLKNLPLLRPTNVVEGREPVVWKMSGKDRWKNRSRTYPGIAAAMGQQWGEKKLPPCMDQLMLLTA